MDKGDKIYVAGHTGLLGSAIVRTLQEKGYTNILTRTRKQLDLTRQFDVDRFFDVERPDYVFLAAAKVGGINYNKTYPADFIVENLQIQTNIIKSSFDYKVKKLCNFGSVCIYPRDTEQPIKEEYFMTGPLEPTNIAYAVAKIAGVVMCQKYTEQYGFNCLNLMPTNLLGVNDRFHPDHSHVIPGMINKFLLAKEMDAPYVEFWGDGSPTREFLVSDDLADAAIFLMNNYNYIDIVNVGNDNEITIKDLAEKIKCVVGYTGDVVWDTTKPNGQPRRKVCTEKMKSLGWEPKISLDEGIRMTYEWFIKNRDNVR